MKQVEKWGAFELALPGHADGNPFLDYALRGIFAGAGEKAAVDGFYDGHGLWRVRFMPSREGVYRYEIAGDAIDAPVTGAFEAVPPTGNNHGPVRVIEGTALAYADGTPHYSFGTTCYAWVHQDEALQETTLRTLSEAPFNKLRFCVFPKFYEFNRREPITHPFERGGGEGLDPALVAQEQAQGPLPGAEPVEADYGFNYLRPNVAHFQRFDRRIAQLRDLGIEADLILMHPYDRWGMNAMSAAACDAYLKYAVARWGAYRNVWWSLANEYDLIRTKTPEDWERYGTLISSRDPYRHMLSAHNCLKYYDFTKPWVTHQSLQRIDFYRHVEETDALLAQYGKPAVWDEICYEGNIGWGWGNITAQELVRRFWEAFLRGGHAGHGETYLDDNDILWWSHGGVLKGESAPRLAFLRRIMAQTPGRFMVRDEGLFDEVVGRAETSQPHPGQPLAYDYCIHYLGIAQPMYRTLFLPEDEDFEVEVIDTWNMTVTPAGVHRGTARIDLPGRQYMALRVRKAKPQ